MSEFFATIGKARIVTARVRVPYAGIWFADCDLEDDTAITGLVDLVLGGCKFNGTIVEAFTGTFGMQTHVRMVAGAAQWAKTLPKKSYHSDAGIKTLTVVQDAAREAGEKLGTVIPVKEAVGADFVRQVGPASRVLERILGVVPWWVDYQGLTQSSLRKSVEVQGDYEVLEYDARHKVATVSCDTPEILGIGSILRSQQRLQHPLVVRQIDISMSGSSMRFTCWGVELP